MQNKETKKTVLVRKQQGPLLYIFISLAIVSILVGGLFYLKQRVSNVGYKSAKIGNITYKLEIADVESKRVKGLSERDGLSQNTGMLFDFAGNGDWRIWMYHMRFNLDIAWLSKDGKIIKIKANAVPGDYPDTYHADQPSWYVIEVPAGTFEKLGVHEGDTINL